MECSNLSYLLDILQDRIYNPSTKRQYLNNKIVLENVSLANISKEYSESLAKDIFQTELQYLYKSQEAYVLSRERAYIYLSKYGRKASPEDMKAKQNADKLVSYVLSEIVLLTGLKFMLLPVLNMDIMYGELEPLLPSGVAKKLSLKEGDRVAVAVKERFHQYALLSNYFKERPLTPQHTKAVLFTIISYLHTIHQHYPEFAHKALTCKNIYMCPADAPGLLPFNLKITHFYSAQLRGVAKQSYDIYTFINSMIQDILPRWKEDEALVAFIYDIISKENVHMNISFDDYSNTLTSEEVLNHSYFEGMKMTGGACGCGKKMEGGGKKKKVVARFETQRKELEAELRRLQTRIEKDSMEAARIKQLLGDYIDEQVPPPQPMNKMAYVLGADPTENKIMPGNLPYWAQGQVPPMFYQQNPYVGVPVAPDQMSLLERQLYMQSPVAGGYEKKNDF